jgi:hypothetical protein
MTTLAIDIQVKRAITSTGVSIALPNPDFKISNWYIQPY